MPQVFATDSTKLSEAWMFKLSTTKTHGACGSVATVCVTCAKKSASVRVGPNVGAINFPVTTSKLPMNVNVP